MHSHGLTHGDVKPSNFLVDAAHRTLRLTDFDLTGGEFQSCLSRGSPSIRGVSQVHVSMPSRAAASSLPPWDRSWVAPRPASAQEQPVATSLAQICLEPQACLPEAGLLEVVPSVDDAMQPPSLLISRPSIPWGPSRAIPSHESFRWYLPRELAAVSVAANSIGSGACAGRHTGVPGTRGMPRSLYPRAPAAPHGA